VLNQHRYLTGVSTMSCKDSTNLYTKINFRDNINMIFTIWGFHRGDYEECSLLGCVLHSATSQKTTFFNTIFTDTISLYISLCQNYFTTIWANIICCNTHDPCPSISKTTRCMSMDTLEILAAHASAAQKLQYNKMFLSCSYGCQIINSLFISIMYT
jgi:hypothetical protein